MHRNKKMPAATEMSRYCIFVRGAGIWIPSTVHPWTGSQRWFSVPNLPYALQKPPAEFLCRVSLCRFISSEKDVYEDEITIRPPSQSVSLTEDRPLTDKLANFNGVNPKGNYTDLLVINKIHHIIMNPTPDMDEELNSLGIHLSEYQVNNILKLQKDAHIALGFFNWVRKQDWYVPSSYSYTILINLTGRERDLASVQQLVASMQEEGCLLTTVTYNTLIKIYAKINFLDEAWNIYEEMQKSGCKPDAYSFNTMLSMYSAAALPEKVADIYYEMVRAGIPLDNITYEIVLPNLCKVGKVGIAFHMLNEIKEKGYVLCAGTYSSLIMALVKMGRLDDGLGLYVSMHDLGLKPNKPTFVALIDSFGKAGKLYMTMKIYEDMQEAGFLPSIAVQTVLIEAHVKAGNLETAMTFYQKMRERGFWPPLRIYSWLIEANAKVGNSNSAIQLYDDMREVGLKPHEVTCRLVIGILTKLPDLEVAKRILLEMKELGLYVDLPISDIIMDLLKDQKVSDAWEFYQSVYSHGFRPSMTVHHKLLSSLLQGGVYEAVRHMLDHTPSCGFATNLETYCLILKAFLINVEEHQEVALLSLMRATRHPAHTFVCKLLGSFHHRKEPLSFFVRSFFVELKTQVEFKSRRQFTNLLIDYLVLMDQPQRARCVWKVAYETQVYPNAITVESDVVWSLSIRNMSVGAAMIAAIVTLEKFREHILKRRFVPQKIKLLTGVRPQSTCLKGALESLFRPLDSPFQYQDDELASFWCRGAQFVKWFRLPYVREILRQKVIGSQESTDIVVHS